MCDAAFDWAKARNLWRGNVMHKEEEVRIVVDDFFKFKEEQGFETRQQGSMEVEARL